MPPNLPFDPERVPPGYGYLECLAVKGDRLVVSGWLLLPDGPCDGYRLVVASRGVDVPIDSFARPDLAHLHVPGAERAGFVALIPTDRIGADEVLDLDVLGMRGGRPVARLRVGYHGFGTPQAYPPADVMRRATGSDNQELWRATGMKGCNDFLRALAPHVDLCKIRTLLEWGCSSGRLTKHLIDRLPHARVTGTDIDHEAVAWAGRHLHGEFVDCDTDPPLPFPDRKFELIVSLSVFTHLTRDYQTRWLPDLQRVLAPGGVMLATTHGDFAARWIFHKPGEYERVMRTGFFDGLRDDALGHVASGDYYRSTFQSRACTEELWSPWFEVLDFVEGGMNNFQDIFVLRNRVR